MSAADARRHSPAAERNAGPILIELQRLLPAQGTALEIASGTGQHAAHFSAGLPGWQWWPSDPDAGALPSIAAWCQGLARVAAPLALDVCQDVPWPGVPRQVDAIYCANMLHISPWPTCAGLMRGAAMHLSAAGLLIVYGPFVIDGEPTAPSNRAFDADLRQRDPRWGLRRLSEVLAQAALQGLTLRERVAMPANNQLLVLCRG
jgi:Protein of unknown function (DUF938)